MTHFIFNGILIARWPVKLIPFSDFGYLIPPGYGNQENCTIAEIFLNHDNIITFTCTLSCDQLYTPRAPVLSMLVLNRRNVRLASIRLILRAGTQTNQEGMEGESRRY